MTTSRSTTPAPPPIDAASVVATLHTEVARLAERVADAEQRFDDLAKAVIPVGVALLEEKDFDRLVDAILTAAQQLCRADGGTLYLRGDDDCLRFAVLRNNSIRLETDARALAPLPLYGPDGNPNHRNVATYAAHTGRCINIADAYEVAGFDFSGTRAFDVQTGYRSRSFLTVPLMNHQHRVIGVLQLLNAIDPTTGAVIAFAPGLEPVVESLAALAAAAVEAFFREEQLRQQISDLQIRIDQSKKARQVAEVTDTEYFRTLQTRARALRDKRGVPSP